MIIWNETMNSVGLYHKSTTVNNHCKDHNTEQIVGWQFFLFNFELSFPVN